MKTFIIIVLIVVAIVIGIAIYLVATTPDSGAGVALPLSASHRDLLARVPASADAFALVPTAAALRGEMLANPVTRKLVADWIEKHPLPPSWFLGGADVVIWKSGKRTSYAVRLDPFRAFLVRAWLTTSDVQARWDGTVFVINAPIESPISEAELTSLLEIGRGLPLADALVVQREEARGLFPPIARPAVSSVQVTPTEIVIASRARAASAAPAALPLRTRLPRGAMLAVAFAQPPRVIEDLNRIFGTRVSALVEHGGIVAIYDVNAGTLLPSPKGVIAAPAGAESRVALGDIARAASLIGETRDTGSELLLSFDRTSIPLYLKDTFEPARFPANDWAARLDPKRLVPILDRLGDSRGLRFATPRLHRAARDLHRWIQALENAQVIEASASTASGTEELWVRIGV